MNEINNEMFMDKLYPSFGKMVKFLVRIQQENRCAMCGEVVPELEIHHRVPENALRRGNNGVKGKDVIENAVGLCHGEHGGGAGSEDDCHEIADMEAIRNKRFFLDGVFVPIDKVPEESYRHVCNPVKAEKHRRKHRR